MFQDSSYSYRHEIIKSLPTLRILDDELTLNTASLSPSKGKTKNDKHHELNEHQCPFDDDWQIINQWIEEGIGPPEEKLAINGELFSIFYAKKSSTISFKRILLKRPPKKWIRQLYLSTFQPKMWNS